MFPEHLIGVAIIVALMIVAGILGGYCRAIFDGTSKTDRFLEVVIPGIVATFIVPLFLNIGKSDIFEKIIRGDDFEGNIFILFAFCLLSAVTAKNFINAIAEKALNEAKKAKIESLRNSKKIDEVEDLVIEAAENITPKNRPMRGESLVNENYLSDLSKDERSVVQAIYYSNFARRSITGISKDSKLDKDKIKQILTDLISKNIVSEMQSSAGTLLYSIKLSAMNPIDTPARSKKAE